MAGEDAEAFMRDGSDGEGFWGVGACVLVLGGGERV